MWRLLSIADVTIKESVRRKVFLGLLLFTSLLIGLAFSLPAIDPQAKLRLIEGWCLRTISFFGVLLSVFLAATSIPDDVEGKKVFLIVTKPITRLQVLAGKLLGFAGVLFLFFVGMGALSVAYIRGIDGSLSGAGSGLLEVRRRIEPSAFSFAQDPEKPGSVNGTFSPQEPPRIWLDHAPDARFHWDFLGIDHEPWGSHIRAELTVHASSRDASFAGDAVVQVFREDTHTRFHRDVRIMWNVPARVEIPAELVAPGGSLRVFVLPKDKKNALGATPTSLVLHSEPIPGGFERNFALSLLVTFAQCVMVVGLTLMGSTMVSGPVSIFLGMFFVVTGSLVGFVRGSMGSVEQTIRHLHQRQAAGDYYADPADIPLWALEYSKTMSRFAVDILPDLGRFGGTPDMVLQGMAIPLDQVGQLLAYAGTYTATAFLLGWMFFSMRELK